MRTVVAFFVVVATMPTIAGGSTLSVMEKLLGKLGTQYVEARETLLSRDHDMANLRKLAQTVPYSAATWRHLVFAEALTMRAAHPQDAMRLQNLDGLDPGTYSSWRRPEPNALPELLRMLHAAPLMIELYLKEMELHGESGDTLETRQNRVLRNDLLRAIGESGHPASVFFLSDVVASNYRNEEVLGIAIRALGATGRLDALWALLGIRDKAAQGPSGNIDLYCAAISAMGQIRHVQTWIYLDEELRNANPRIRVAAVRGARVYGSRWHWDNQPKMRQTVGFALLRILTEAKDHQVVRATLESFGNVATTALREELRYRLRRAGISLSRSLVKPEEDALGATVMRSVSKPDSSRNASARDRLESAFSRVSQALNRR